MKIDLHIHTLVTTQGENNNRNIDPESFVNKMIDNKIGVAAITNHNKFDINYYEEVCRLIKEEDNLLLLPGIELDINYNNGQRRQLNLIISNECDLNIFLNEIRNFLNSDRSINDLSECFSSEKILLYIDTKRSKTSWKDDEINYLLDNLDKDKFAIICDVNNMYSLIRYRARNYNVLVGSDVSDWDKYDEKAKKLVDINISINSFNFLLDALVYNDEQTYLDLFGGIKNQIEKNISITIENNKEVNIGNIKIYDGINIIFGGKATGKTNILKKLYSEFKSTSSYYESDNKEKIFDDFINEKINEISLKDEINKKYNKLKNIIDFIKNFKDKSFNDWGHLFESFYNDEPYKFISEYFNYKNLSKPKLESYKRAIKASKDLEIELKNLEFSNQDIEYVGKIKNKLIILYIEKMKEYWKNTLYSKISDKLNDLSMQNNGKNTSVKKIFLFERYENRKKMKNLLDSLKKDKWDNTYKVEDLDISDRGQWSLHVSHYTINFSDIDNYLKDDNKFLVKRNISKLNKLKKLLNMNPFNADGLKILYDRDLNELFKLLEDKKYFCYDWQIIDVNGQKIIPSNGEKTLIALSLFFNNSDKENYFLDEPDVFLNAKNIIQKLIELIWSKNKLNKRIIIVTHNPMLAINSIPFNMIYRERIDNDNYNTYIGNPWINSFIDINDKANHKNFSELILEAFEYKIQHFNFRKDIYNGK